MRTILCLVTVFFFLNAAAQDDDLQDYRPKRDNFSRVAEKDIQADLAVFTLSGIDQSVGKLPLKSLPITKYSSGSIQFDSGNISVVVTSGAFELSRHKLQYSGKYLVKIDNKPFFGSYGAIPRRTIQSVMIVINHDSISVPQSAMEDLFDPGFTYTEGGNTKSYSGVYFSADNRRMYIYLLSNDKGGGYEVTWVIQDKKYLRRIVDFGMLK